VRHVVAQVPLNFIVYFALLQQELSLQSFEFLLDLFHSCVKVFCIVFNGVGPLECLIFPLYEPIFAVAIVLD